MEPTTRDLLKSEPFSNSFLKTSLTESSKSYLLLPQLPSLLVSFNMDHQAPLKAFLSSLQSLSLLVSLLVTTMSKKNNSKSLFQKLQNKILLFSEEETVVLKPYPSKNW